MREGVMGGAERRRRWRRWRRAQGHETASGRRAVLVLRWSAVLVVAGPPHTVAAFAQACFFQYHSVVWVQGETLHIDINKANLSKCCHRTTDLTGRWLPTEKGRDVGHRW